VFSERDLGDELLEAVQSVMDVHDVTREDSQEGTLARFRGHLRVDSQEAYEHLEPTFSRAGATLLLRESEGDHFAIALPGVIEAQPSNPWVNLVLFLLTMASMLFAGALYALDDPSLVERFGLWPALIRSLPQGVSFAVSLLSILLAHEFGHYLAARYHRSPVTLPYFLPFPGSYFGTLGAFIRLKAPPRNKRVLLDIGLAGPLAGLVVAIPVLFLGLSLSEVKLLPASLEGFSNVILEGNSIFYLSAKYLVSGEWLPAPADYGGLPPALYWLRYFFLGSPAPVGGRDVFMHPVAWAGWAGLLVTALNLIPAGQLDGGHVLYVLLGKGARRVWPFIVVLLALLGMVWFGWFIWAGLVFFLGRTYAQPLDDITPLDRRRTALAVLGLILFVLLFTPVPLRGFSG
jgi:membrane-associated protease RseP (regulator of RpoE activity)